MIHLQHILLILLPSNEKYEAKSIIFTCIGYLWKSIITHVRMHDTVKKNPN